MTDVSILWFGLLVVMAALYQLSTKWLTHLSIFTFFLAGMFLRYGIAVPFSDDINSIVTGLRITRDELFIYRASVALTYVSVLAGVMVARAFPAVRGARASAEPVDPQAVNIVSTILLTLVILTWIVLPWQELQGSFSAIFTPNHTSVDYRLQRVTYGNAASYSVSFVSYVGSLARFGLMPAALWILYFLREHSRSSKGLFWLSFLVLAIIGVLSGQKTPALLLALGWLLAYVLKNGPVRRWPIKLVAAAAICFLVVLPTLYRLQYPDLTYTELLQSSLYRLTTEYSRVAQLRFMFYPSHHGYLYGLSSFLLRGFASLMGLDTRGFDSPETYLPDVIIGRSYGGTWNAGFFADAWADFGLLGVLAFSFVVGIMLVLIHRWYENGPKGAVQKGAYVALCISAVNLSEVSLSNAVWSHGLLATFVVVVTVTLLTRRRFRTTSRSLRRTLAEIGAEESS